MMMQYAVRGGHGNRRHHYPKPINIKPVSTTVVLYNGEEGKSFIPTVPLDVVSCCRTDGNSYAASGPFPVYFGPAVNGAYGRIVTYRDICDNQGSIVKCRFGLNCHRVHANMGIVMTGLRGTKPQVIGPLRADLKQRHMELFTMSADQLARRQAIDTKHLEGQRAELQRLEDEENAIEGAKDEQADLAERILRAKAKKDLREAETSARTNQELVAQETKPAKKRRRLAAPEPTIEPTVQVTDEADPNLAAAAPISISKTEEADAADTGLGDDTTPQVDIGEPVDTSDTAAADEPEADGESDTTTTGEPNAPPGVHDEVVRADSDGN
jgi:hypothetical protein